MCSPRYSRRLTPGARLAGRNTQPSLIVPRSFRERQGLGAATAPWSNAWRRQSPILGAEGFDGGFKPAIAFALPQRREEPTTEDFDTAPPPSCGLGYYLNYLITGVGECSDCWFETRLFPAFGRKLTFSGVNNAGIAAWNGSGWVAIIGIGTLTKYQETTGCETPIEDPPENFDIILFISCTGETDMQYIIGGSVGTGTESLNPSYFNGGGTLGDLAPNAFGFGGCTSGFLPDIQAGYDGFITVVPTP